MPAGSGGLTQRLLGTGGGGGGGGGVGARLLADSQGCAFVLCQDCAPQMDLSISYCLSDLVDCFELVCDGYDRSSVFAHPGVAGVRFDVSVWSGFVLRGGDSTCPGAVSMMSDVTSDGHWFPVAMTARLRLCFVTRGAGACDSSNQP